MYLPKHLLYEALHLEYQTEQGIHYINVYDYEVESSVCAGKHYPKYGRGVYKCMM